MFTGSKNHRACDRKSREDHGNMKGRVKSGPHRDEQCRQGRTYTDSGEIQVATEEDEASKGWTDRLIRKFTSV